MTNRIAEYRTRAGLSAAALAAQARVTRQSIYAMEAGDFVPNTAVALRLAKALEATVENLFSEETNEAPEPLTPMRKNQPARLAYVYGKLIAVPATALSFPLSTPPAPSALVIAGCDPAISLLGAGVVPFNCSSTRALELLAACKVHIAGTHIGGRLKKGHRAVTLAHWEEGIVTAPGNPKGIRSIANLAGRAIVNREPGSGSRMLLDRELRAAGVDVRKLRGYKREASGHLEAAWYVHAGLADVCIATGSAARAYGLDFHPLATERYELVFAESLDAEAFLNLLVSAPVRRVLESQAGYDTSHTGSARP